MVFSPITQWLLRTNITYNNMKRTFALLAAIGVSLVSVSAQPSDSSRSPATSDTLYSLTAYVSGGYAHDVSSFEISPAGLDRGGAGFSVRVMWKPEHLLRMGLEIGRTHVYSVKQEGLQTAYGKTDVNLTLNATPILLVFSMSPFDNLDVYVGGGSAFLNSDAQSFGSTSATSSLSGGAMAAVSYMRPLSDAWSIGGEAKWLYFDKYDDTVVSVQVMVSFKFLEW
jgi:hypothetical protein